MARLTPERSAELEAFWRSHHEGWANSSLNQREYCEAHGLPLKRFGNWRAKFKDEEAVAGAALRGRVRIKVNVPFGLTHLLPLVPGFVSRHPEIVLDIALTDQVIDLLDERADLAISVGPLRASQLIAHKPGKSRMAVVALPDDLVRAATLEVLADLVRRNHIAFNFARSLEGWLALRAGRTGRQHARDQQRPGRVW